MCLNQVVAQSWSWMKMNYLMPKESHTLSCSFVFKGVVGAYKNSWRYEEEVTGAALI